MGRRTRTAEEIAEELLDRAVPNGDCLECHLQPSRDREGRERCYTQVGGRNGVKWLASRLVAHHKKGPIPDGLWVLHSCDNSRCINPEHLFYGTAQDNTDDMIAKGRKVDDPEVGARRRAATGSLIQSLHAKGYTDGRIAAEYGISRSTIWNYTNGPYASSVAVPSGDEHYVRVGLDSPRDAKDVS